MKTITETELKKILVDHLLWIESEKKQGKMANLSGVNLFGVMLNCANLEGANLSGANLQHTWLENANLENANLEGANIKGVHFFFTNLRGTILEKS